MTFASILLSIHLFITYEIAAAPEARMATRGMGAMVLRVQGNPGRPQGQPSGWG